MPRVESSALDPSSAEAFVLAEQAFRAKLPSLIALSSQEEVAQAIDEAAGSLVEVSVPDKSFCPAGYVLETRPGTKPQPNGCGPARYTRFAEIATKTLPQPITACCNIHDIEYDTCGTSKKDADSRFFGCLNTVFTVTPSLGGSFPGFAAVMYAGVRLGGGSAFASAQAARCQCRKGTQVSQINTNTPKVVRASP